MSEMALPSGRRCSEKKGVDREPWKPQREHDKRSPKKAAPRFRMIVARKQGSNKHLAGHIHVCICGYVYIKIYIYIYIHKFIVYPYFCTHYIIFQWFEWPQCIGIYTDPHGTETPQLRKLGKSDSETRKVRLGNSENRFLSLCF